MSGAIFGVMASGGIHQFADSQFGHLFASGSTREEARRNMIVALSELTIRGEIRTAAESLRTMLEHPDFIANRISTTWLETVMAESPELISGAKPPASLVSVLGAVVIAHTQATERHTEYMESLDRGRFWSPNPITIF
eukprot:GABV01002605.1.p1 GENE.GABV01002605.1~~GABV01002605.1.p1  ORF type:complete len:138 (-),score=54.85 GABV01002605.1:245-658(-)